MWTILIYLYVIGFGLSINFKVYELIIDAYNQHYGYDHTKFFNIAVFISFFLLWWLVLPVWFYKRGGGL
jgi:hypothetical protein